MKPHVLLKDKPIPTEDGEGDESPMNIQRKKTEEDNKTKKGQA